MPADLQRSLARLTRIDDAIAGFRQSGHDVTPVLGARQMLVAQIALIQGETDDGFAAYRQSIEHFRAAGMDAERATVATEAAVSAEQRGRYRDGLWFTDAALDTADWTAGRTRRVDPPATPQALSAAADVGVRLAARQGDVNRVFDYAQRSKARWIVEALALAEFESLPIPIGRRPVDACRAQALRSALDHLDAAWNALGSEDPAAQVDSAEEEVLAAYEGVAAAPPTSGLNAATLDEVRSALNDGEALLEWFVESSGVCAVLVRGDGAHLETWSWPARALREELIGYLGLLQGGAPQGDGRRQGKGSGGRHLGARLIGPLASRLDGISRLVVCPHWALHALPFAALLDAAAPASAANPRRRSGPLAVTQAPSATAWLHIRRARASLLGVALSSDSPSGAASPVVIGVGRVAATPAISGCARSDSDFDSDSALWAPPVALVEEEARAVAAGLGVTAVVGRAATKEAVRRALAGRRTVHLGAHRERARQGPLLDGVVLADGVLTLVEILTAPAFAHARPGLIVVSACPRTVSACPRTLDPADVDERALGVPHAFLARLGCRVLACLWRADGEATALLLTRFVAHRSAPDCDDAEALRRAREDVRAAHSKPLPSGESTAFADPRYWAGFVLLGD